MTAGLRDGDRSRVTPTIRSSARAAVLPEGLTEVTLYHEVKRVDVAARILKDSTPLVEPVPRVPVSISEKPEIRFESCASVIRPIEDQWPGIEHDSYAVQHWVDLHDARRGRGLVALDSPIVELRRAVAGVRLERPSLPSGAPTTVTLPAQRKVAGLTSTPWSATTTSGPTSTITRAGKCSRAGVFSSYPRRLRQRKVCSRMERGGPPAAGVDPGAAGGPASAAHSFCSSRHQTFILRDDGSGPRTATGTSSDSSKPRGGRRRRRFACPAARYRHPDEPGPKSRSARSRPREDRSHLARAVLDAHDPGASDR